MLICLEYNKQNKIKTATLNFLSRLGKCLVCCVVLCYVVLCYVMLSYAMLCYLMICYAIPCHVILCYVVLYYAMLYFCLQGNSLANVYTPLIMRCDAVRHFWVAWGEDNGQEVISIGVGQYVNERRFLHYNTTKIYPVNSISLSTGWGSQGHWEWDVSQGKL